MEYVTRIVEKIVNLQLLRIFEPLDLISIADVLKLVLRTLSGPLITSRCKRKLILAPLLLPYDDSADISITYEHAVTLYINSTLSMLTYKRFDIIQKLLSFLLRVIAHEAKSRMGVTNISTLFAPILFGMPHNAKGKSCDSFVEENTKTVELLQFLLLQAQQHPKYFKHKSNMIQSRYAIRNFEFQDKQFVMGEKIELFHRTADTSLIVFKKRIYEVPLEIMRSSFSPLKPACDSSMLRTSLRSTALRNKKFSKSSTELDQVEFNLGQRAEVLPIDSLVSSFSSLAKLNSSKKKLGSTSYRGSRVPV